MIRVFLLAAVIAVWGLMISGAFGQEYWLCPQGEICPDDHPGSYYQHCVSDQTDHSLEVCLPCEDGYSLDGKDETGRDLCVKDNSDDPGGDPH